MVKVNFYKKDKKPSEQKSRPARDWHGAACFWAPMGQFWDKLNLEINQLDLAEPFDVKINFNTFMEN